MIAIQNCKPLIASTIFALIASTPAFAHGGHGPGAGRPSGVRALHSRGVLGQLIFPCQAACTDTAQSCAESADSTATSCISSACPDEITAAQTACAADRSSDACESAVEALRDCAADCLDTRATAVGICRDALRDCNAACESDQ
jgi:hypothetical protein